jgi:hypothetical protein
MICTRIDEHFKSLIRDMEILWSVILDDGTEVYSDYYVENLDSPWVRLKEYCESNGRYIVRVNCIMFGADKFVMAYDPNGLDGVIVNRGLTKEISINDSGDPGVAYKHLVCGVLRPDTTIVDVKKFSWPENALEPFIQTRALTLNNLSLMIFKNERTREEAHKKLCIS